MDIIKEKLKSKAFKITLYCVGFFVVALIIFQVGVFVGIKKASFSYGWGDNYKKTFGEPEQFRMGMMMQGNPPGGDLPDAHGAIGKIIKIQLPTIITIGPDSIERIILIKDDTLIKKFRDDLKAEELKIDDEIVVIGSPNESSQIEAKLIRLMPAKETAN